MRELFCAIFYFCWLPFVVISNAVNPEASFTVCPSGLRCQNGICQELMGDNILGFQCVCFPGWTGIFCETGVFASTGYEIEATERTGEEQFQEETLQSDVVVSTPSILPTTSLQEDSMAHRNVCSSDYAPHPETDRTCFSNFKCVYGTCHMTPHENQIAVKCTCDVGATGILCEKKCCLDCGEHGTCTVIGEQIFCNCQIGYTGEHCQVKLPTEDSDKGIDRPSHAEAVTDKSLTQSAPPSSLAITIMIPVGIILLLALGMLPYVLWRRRYVYVMKAVRYFQPYEEDGLHDWDVLVWTSDEEKITEFVRGTLLPAMQYMQLKVCVFKEQDCHTTDATEYLKSLVKKSRRVLVIPTHNFIQSAVPYLEQLKVPSSKLFSICSKSLQTVENTDKMAFLKSTTALQYPCADDEEKQREFWTVLELLLPKKRNSIAPTADEDLDV